MAAGARDPSIVVFACTWYPLTAADNAGEDGCQYGASTTIVPVECGGCITVAAILRAFARGAGGVIVAACGAGDCHYANGNESCEEAAQEARELMRLAGIAPERLKVDLSSDVDGSRFASLVNDFASELSALGGDGRGRGRQGRGRSKSRSRPKRARRVGAGKKPGRRKAAGRKRARSTEAGGKPVRRAKAGRRPGRRAKAGGKPVRRESASRPVG